MAFVILIACLILTKLFNQVWFNKKIYGVSALTNVISGIVGMAISMILNSGWYFVVWFPWVNSNEITLSNKESPNGLTIFYLGAFMLTVIAETLTNWLIIGCILLQLLSNLTTKCCIRKGFYFKEVNITLILVLALAY